MCGTSSSIFISMKIREDKRGYNAPPHIPKTPYYSLSRSIYSNHKRQASRFKAL